MALVADKIVPAEEHSTPERVNLNAILSPASFWLPERLIESAWLQHGPFAFWIMEALKPRRVVELGTHHGFSYLAFCQAVRRLKLDTQCFAVDTWAGDEHAGRYSDQVYQTLRAYHEPRYADFSRLVRARFDEAVSYFEDGSIDLLHIDGRHFYEDAKEDYELWRPKLSDRAVVMFHDTNVRERRFGVWQLWGEIAPSYPNFEFLHGHGLGVLGYGPNIPASVTRFLAEATAHQTAVRETYFRLGAAIEDRANRAVPAQPPVAAPVIKAAQTAASDFHIHVAAMAPRFLDVRTRLPLHELSKVPGVSTSISEQKIELPRLPPEQPKVLVLQRLSLPSAERWAEIATTLAGRGWVVVAELDDHPELIAAVHKRSVDASSWHAVRFAHAAQTSTDAMADAIRPHNPEVAVFPNTAFRIAASVAAPRPDGSLRVFFGALNREQFSRRIGAALAAFAARHRDIEFVVVHDRAFFEALGDVRKSFHPALPYAQYLDAMAGCDVALMPLEGGPGERFKSDVKFVEASALGLASIVSPIVYGDTVVDGETGLLCEAVEDWAGALARLHGDPALRRALAETAYNYVRHHRLPPPQTEARIQWYRGLWQRRAALGEALGRRLPPKS